MTTHIGNMMAIFGEMINEHSMLKLMIQFSQHQLKTLLTQDSHRKIDKITRITIINWHISH